MLKLFPFKSGTVTETDELFWSVYNFTIPFLEIDTPALGFWDVTISSSEADVIYVNPKSLRSFFDSDIVLFFKSGMVIKEVSELACDESFEGIPK